jgi:hypothetical protein
MQNTCFDNVNVAKVKHQAKCITCSMKHRKHLKNVILPMQVVINMKIKEFCFYSFFVLLTIISRLMHIVDNDLLQILLHLSSIDLGPNGSKLFNHVRQNYDIEQKSLNYYQKLQSQSGNEVISHNSELYES